MRMTLRHWRQHGPRVDRDVHAVVMVADPKRLRQVLVNLLSNASKYSPSDTGITVKFTTTAGEFVFEVIDQGPGISPGDAERVFNLFDRGSNTEAHTQPGTGIGLYVARKIVEAHGGTISLRPLRGGGTVAKFTVPIAQPEQLAKIA